MTTDEAYIYAEVYKKVFEETQSTRKAETAAYWATREWQRMIK